MRFTRFSEAIRPHPETALACSVALAPPERARVAWERWHSLLGPDGIVAVSPASGRLLPLIASRLDALGLISDGRARGAHKKSLTRNFILWHHLQPLLSTLAADGVPVALAGALGRARSVYPDFGASYLTRADLAIAPAHLGRAVAVLGTCGWRPRFSVSARPPVSDRHLFSAGEDDLVLRTHLVPESLGHGPDRPARLVPGPVLPVLAPEHALIQIASDAMVSTPDRFVDWLADLALTLQRGPIDWELLVSEARRLDLPLTLATALACLPPIGVDLPDGLLDRLHGGPLEERALAARLAPRRPLAAVFYDYRHAVAPAAGPLEAGAGFIRYAALRLGLARPTDVPRVARYVYWRTRARLQRTSTTRS